MSRNEIERRLTVLELELALLKEGPAPAGKPHPIDVLEQIHGTFENDRAFQQAMALGRRWREAQRPRPRKAKRR